jgi:hypothetical protein
VIVRERGTEAGRTPEGIVALKVLLPDRAAAEPLLRFSQPTLVRLCGGRGAMSDGFLSKRARLLAVFWTTSTLTKAKSKC